MVRNAIRLSALVLLYILTNSAKAQTRDRKSQLTFTGKNPDRGGKPVSPSHFISLIDVNKLDKPKCEYSFCSIQFKVAKNETIDSIQVTGTVFPSLKRLLLEQVKRSKPYWKCKNCSKEGYWITLPIFIYYQAGCHNDPGPVSFWDTSDYFFDTIDKWGTKNKNLDGIFIAPRRLILKPIYFGSQK